MANFNDFYKILDEKLIGSDAEISNTLCKKNLLESYDFCGLKLKNHFCFSNLTDSEFFDLSGNVTEKFFDFYESVAKSNVGLICTGGVYVGSDKRNQSKNLSRSSYPKFFNDAKNLEIYRKTNDAIHSFGSRVFLTLKPTFGRGDYKNQFLKTFNYSIGLYRNVFDSNTMTLRLSDGKISNILKNFVKCVKNISELNFDGVVIDGSNFNIFGELSSTEFNNRFFGNYASDSAFALKLVTDIKKACPDTAIIYKLTVATFIKNFYGEKYKDIKTLKNISNKAEDFSLLLNFSENLVKCGVDGFMLDFGTFETEFLNDFSPFSAQNLFAQIKNEISNYFEKIDLKNKFGEKPTLILCDNFYTVGSSEKQNFSTKSNSGVEFQQKRSKNAIFSDNYNSVDDCIFCITKHIYADSKFLAKIKSENFSKINPCINCSNCNFYASNFGKVVCSVNPALFNCHFEKCNQINSKVAVVGGGTSGMIAALILAKRGFSVDLFEKNSTLNKSGRLCEIFGFDNLLKKFNDKLESDVLSFSASKSGNAFSAVSSLSSGEKIKTPERGKINIRLKEKFDVEKIKPDDYFAIFVATGFHEKYFDAVGAVLKNVKTIYEFLDNENFYLTNQNFVIYAMSELSFKVALFLSSKNKKVTLILSDKNVLKSMSNGKLTYYAVCFKKLNIKVYVGAKIKKIEEDFVELIINQKYEKFSVDALILNIRSGQVSRVDQRAKCLGLDIFIYEPEIYSNNKLFYDLALCAKNTEIYMIGNALAVCDDLYSTVSSAYFASKNL